MKQIICLSFAWLLISNAYGHGVIDTTRYPAEDRNIQFPDTEHYKTLVLDPHTHSVFSDGHVWPTTRVAEALRDGLDAIAITEHLEWQPHLQDIPHPDRNRSFEIAVDANGKNDLMIIAGSEITRRSPAGHINALFISDANKMLSNFVPEDPSDVRAYYVKMTEWPAQDAVDAANDQGAFLFWNHSWWATDFPDLIPVASKFHRQNAKKKKLHGIEIANGASYSEEAFQIALDLDLTLIGVSDIHGLIDWDYKPHEGGHRPVTLVLAKERSQASLSEALFLGRTVVWYKNTLIAHKENMQELLNASLKITSASYTGDSQVLNVQIRNNSDADFHLRSTGKYSFVENTGTLEVGQHETIQLTIKTGKRVKKIDLKFDVLNTLVKPKEYAKFKLSSKVELVAEPAVE